MIARPNHDRNKSRSTPGTNTTLAVYCQLATEFAAITVPKTRSPDAGYATPDTATGVADNDNPLETGG